MCASTLSMISEYAMTCASSAWEKTAGLHSQKRAAKASITRLIFCASPGSLIVAIIRRIPESSGRPSSWSELITSFSAPLLFSSSLPSRSPTMSWSSFPSLSSRKRARSAALSPRRPCSTSSRTPLLPELAVLKR